MFNKEKRWVKKLNSLLYGNGYRRKVYENEKNC